MPMNLINFQPNAYGCCGTFIPCFRLIQFIGFQIRISLETQRLCHLTKYDGDQSAGNSFNDEDFLNLTEIFLLGFGECTNPKQLMAGHLVLD